MVDEATHHEMEAYRSAMTKEVLDAVAAQPVSVVERVRVMRAQHVMIGGSVVKLRQGDILQGDNLPPDTIAKLRDAGVALEDVRE